MLNHLVFAFAFNLQVLHPKAPPSRCRRGGLFLHPKPSPFRCKGTCFCIRSPPPSRCKKGVCFRIQSPPPFDAKRVFSHPKPPPFRCEKGVLFLPAGPPLLIQKRGFVFASKAPSLSCFCIRGPLYQMQVNGLAYRRMARAFVQWFRFVVRTNYVCVSNCKTHQRVKTRHFG